MPEASELLKRDFRQPNRTVLFGKSILSRSTRQPQEALKSAGWVSSGLILAEYQC
jgi:hypothetical protein